MAMSDDMPGCGACAFETAAARARLLAAAVTGSRGGRAEDLLSELAGMRAAFPGWNVWLSDEGGWWATRNRPLPPSRWPDDFDLTVGAADSLGLCAQIARQPG